MLEDLEVEDCLVHVVDEVNVELQIVLRKLFKEAKEAGKKAEPGILILVLHQRADKLLEFLVRYILEPIFIVEEFPGPFDEVGIVALIHLSCSRHYLVVLRRCIWLALDRFINRYFGRLDRLLLGHALWKAHP